MAKPIFVSYRHHQAEWVWKNLIPVLEGAGTQLAIDCDRFKAGEGVKGQMDAEQDKTDATVVVLTNEYLASDYCRHELDRAVAKNNHRVIPIVRDDCDIPENLEKPDPILRVDLRPPEDPYQWGALLDACEAPTWQKAIRDTSHYLNRGQSVNLVCDSDTLWKPLLRNVRNDLPESMGEVDLERGLAISRPGLVNLILEACGISCHVPAEPEDLITLDAELSARNSPALLAMLHFDYAKRRENYGIDLFTTLRHLMMGSRKLVLLAHSHQDFANLLPRDHPMSNINISTVDLRVRRR